MRPVPNDLIFFNVKHPFISIIYHHTFSYKDDNIARYGTILDCFLSMTSKVLNLNKRKKHVYTLHPKITITVYIQMSLREKLPLKYPSTMSIIKYRVKLTFENVSIRLYS